MQMPDCYDPVRQAEKREEHWDDYISQLPTCALCSRRIYPGEKVHTAHYKRVCTNCKEQLEDDVDIVEVD